MGMLLILNFGRVDFVFAHTSMRMFLATLKGVCEKGEDRILIVLHENVHG